MTDKLQSHMLGPGPETLADAIADLRLAVGDFVLTQGFDAANDGGGALYQVRSTGVTGDGVSHAMASGLKLMLVHPPGFFRLEWAGVLDGIECSARWQAGFDYAASLASSIANSGTAMFVTCEASFYIKDTLWPVSKNLHMRHTGTITAIAGGNLDDSTPTVPVPMLKLGTQFGRVDMGTLDGNRICAGVLVMAAQGCTFVPQNVVHCKEYHLIAAVGAGRNFKLIRANIKQWMQEDAEFTDDAEFTSLGLVVGQKDMKFLQGTYGWCRIPILCLAATPADIGDQIEGENILYKGTAAQITSEGCGDAYLTEPHVMQSRPDGPPRMEQFVDFGGCAGIVNYSLGRGPKIDRPDMDCSQLLNYGNWELIMPTATTGMSSDVPFDEWDGFQQYPTIRNYHNGQSNPLGNVTVETGAGWSIGFYDRGANTWGGLWDAANLLARAQSTGWTGVIRNRGVWDASTGAFPSGSGRLAGDQWVVSVAGTVDGHAFTAGYLLTALVNSPSTSTYAANWIESYWRNVPAIKRSTGASIAQGEIQYFTGSDGNRDYHALYSTNDTATRSVNLPLHTYEEKLGGAGLTLTVDSSAWVMTTAGVWRPNDDATQNLGGGSYRINNSYFAVSPTVSSDFALKTMIRLANDDERTAAEAIAELFCAYKMKSAVAEKGDGARWHFGVIAQEVQAAVIAAGLDPAMYAFWCEDETVQGIRYDELHSFLRACGV